MWVLDEGSLISKLHYIQGWSGGWSSKCGSGHGVKTVEECH